MAMHANHDFLKNFPHGHFRKFIEDKSCYAMLILARALRPTGAQNYLVELIVHVEFTLVKYKFTFYLVSSLLLPPSLPRVRYVQSA